MAWRGMALLAGGLSCRNGLSTAQLNMVQSRLKPSAIEKEGERIRLSERVRESEVGVWCCGWVPPKRCVLLWSSSSAAVAAAALLLFVIVAAIKMETGVGGSA